MPPPDFDIDRPSPDAGHEAIRRAVLQAIDDARTNAAGVDDSLWLVDVVFGLLDSALAAVDSLQQALAMAQATADDQAAALLELTDRVAALEEPAAEPDPGDAP